MENVKIIGCGYAHGSKCVTNDDLGKIVETSDEWIRSRTGIEQRTVSETMNTSDLAIQAAKMAIEKSGIDKHKISLILVATCTPDHVTPSCACLVQEGLGLTMPLWRSISMQPAAGFSTLYSAPPSFWIRGLPWS